MMSRTTIFLVIFVVAVSLSLAFSQPSPMKVAATDDDRGINYNNGPCIDRAPNGQVICIWGTKANHNNAILWSSYDDVFGFWNTPQVLGNGMAERATPALVADDHNHFHATWSDNYKLMYSQFDGVNWSTPVQVYKDTINANKSSVIVGIDGKIWVAWSTYRENDDIHEWLMISHSEDNGTTWSVPDTLASKMHPGIVSSYFCVPHLAAGPNGKIGVAYREKDTRVSAMYQIYFQEHNGAGWSEPELITTFSDSVNCYQASIAYDSKGRLHCVFYTNETDWPRVDMGQIYYTWKDDGGAWASPVAITADPNGIADYPAIAIGPNDALYVVYLSNYYVDGTGRLQVYAVTSADRGQSWSEPMRVSDGTVALALRSASIGKHPRPAGIGGTTFEGGADLLWIQPDLSEPDGNAVCYGRIPWVETTPVAETPSPVQPARYSLSQNYPNPFNEATEIEFHLPTAGLVQLLVYNLQGEQVADVMNRVLPSGSHRVHIHANSLASGIYFYKLKVQDFVAIRKMIVVK